MKKATVATSIMIIATFVVFGSIVFADMPSPDPDALWNYITKVSPYKEWSFWPDHQGMQPGRAPHGPLHKVYVNDRALNSVRPPVQYGSIAVKENYDKAKELKAITVMYKVNGYNPKDGDWFWAKYTLDGKAGPFGKPQGCIGCHGTRAKNDFITVHEFK
jgi:hypothetical protein